jgi:hypothetical protein
MITVEWKDSRDSSGNLQVSYTNSRGRKRNGLIVDRIEARPTQPLYKAGWSKYQPMIPVEGTKSSLIIDFKNVRKLSLGFGFSSTDEMNRTYEALKWMVHGSEAAHYSRPGVPFD